jgi:hypothetical protein
MVKFNQVADLQLLLRPVQQLQQLLQRRQQQLQLQLTTTRESSPGGRRAGLQADDPATFVE